MEWTTALYVVTAIVLPIAVYMIWGSYRQMFQRGIVEREVDVVCDDGVVDVVSLQASIAGGNPHGMKFEARYLPESDMLEISGKRRTFGGWVECGHAQISREKAFGGWLECGHAQISREKAFRQEEITR